VLGKSGEAPLDARAAASVGAGGGTDLHRSGMADAISSSPSPRLGLRIRDPQLQRPAERRRNAQGHFDIGAAKCSGEETRYVAAIPALRWASKALVDPQ
jgi:hypothetical protein